MLVHLRLRRLTLLRLSHGLLAMDIGIMRMCHVARNRPDRALTLHCLWVALGHHGELGMLGLRCRLGRRWTRCR